jgi:hypothetical protein
MLLNAAIIVILLHSQMSTMNYVVYNRTLRASTPCFIWEHMLWKGSAIRLRTGGMDVDSGVDIIFCGLQSLVNPPQNFQNYHQSAHHHISATRMAVWKSQLAKC